MLVPSPLHGMLRQINSDVTCQNCHPEHRGADAPLTNMEAVNFLHNSFGFSMTGHQAKTDGSSFGCNDCHAQGYTGFDQETCARCHSQIDPSFIQTHSQDFGGDCLACHDGVDSYGANFDHRAVAFEVTGKHAQVPCTQCHLKDHSLVELKATPQDCNSCHAAKDPHKGSYGIECDSCHSSAGWTPATFDHNLSPFKLTGKHAGVACDQCHINNLYNDATPTGCYSCHQKDDTHKGSLGNACGSCHSNTGWKAASYDHNLSVFKLSGKHVSVACAGCHANNIYNGTPMDCNSCHKKEDNHAGKYGTECGLCHSTAAWKPAILDHNLSIFKLTGKHVNVACTSCHVNNIYTGTPTDCYACHKNDDHHGGQYGMRCGSCHSTSGWTTATFDHNLSSFKLTGSHTSVACTSCHVDSLYKGTPTDCYSCHGNDDVHGGQYGASCGSCHSTSSWTTTTFNHNLSSFKLTGSHTTVACMSCHINNVYKGTSTDCYSCHRIDDHHSGQYGTSCGSCHSTSGWTTANFDHNLSTFKLTGSHTTVTCTSCHVNNVYKGTPSDCYSCHRNDDSHGGQFGSNCASCHSTSGWTPATFDHNKSAFPLTGAHVSLGCSQCHSGAEYSGLSTACSACHTEPSVHAGMFGTDCGQCHSTSNWDASFSHPGGCDGNCADHRGATCADCHPVNYSTATCAKCHERTPGGGN
jgi:hypothetical protein